MPDVYVGLGSNREPDQHLRSAVAGLQEIFGTVRCSCLYRSPAFGDPAPDYCNLAATFATNVGSAALVDVLAGLERAAGRQRAPHALVSLDVDLLMYGSRVDARLRLPRADVLRRAYVLAPLAELAPDVRHPVTGVRIGAAWNELASARPAVQRSSVRLA
jgi:2-amino-4-hydroxy-6-hydroxymethyldihydropteridine diphosphokinase